MLMEPLSGQAIVKKVHGQKGIRRLAFRDEFFQTREFEHVYQPGRHSALLKNQERPAFGAFYWWLVWSLMWESSELLYAII